MTPRRCLFDKNYVNGNQNVDSRHGRNPGWQVFIYLLKILCQCMTSSKLLMVVWQFHSKNHTPNLFSDHKKSSWTTNKHNINNISKIYKNENLFALPDILCPVGNGTLLLFYSTNVLYISSTYTHIHICCHFAFDAQFFAFAPQYSHISLAIIVIIIIII